MFDITNLTVNADSSNIIPNISLWFTDISVNLYIISWWIFANFEQKELLQIIVFDLQGELLIRVVLKDGENSNPELV